jgi:heptosyltransferase I
VSAYDEAARKFLGKPAAELPWTRKIEEPGVMELISVDQVTRKIGELLGSPP